MAEANFIVRARDRTRDALAGADARLAKLQGRMRSFGGAGLGRALGAGAMLAYGRAALTTADNIDNLSQRMRLGHESVQSMSVLMREAGMSVEMLQAPLDRLKQQMDQANLGNTAAAQSFADIGISLADLEKMTPEQALEAVSRALHKNQNDARTGAAATDLLGARSTRLNHVLQQLGAQGFQGLNKSMLDSARIMSTDMIKAGDKMEQDLSRALDRLSVKGKTFAVEFMGGLRAQYLRHIKGLSWDEIAADLFGTAEMPTVQLAPPPTEEIAAPIIDAGQQVAEEIKNTLDQFTSADLINRSQQNNQNDPAVKQRETMINYQRLTHEVLLVTSRSPIGA